MRQIRKFSQVVLKSTYHLPELSSRATRLSVPKLLLDKFSNNHSLLDEIAIVDGSSNTSLTYRNLYNATYEFANALRNHGITSGACVAIISPNHLHYFTVFHGTALTGAYTTTVNPAYTEEEIEYQIQM